MVDIATTPQTDIFEILKNIQGLKKITAKSCCEFMELCEDTIKYLAEREEVLPSKTNQKYEALENQVLELCTHGTELKDKTLTCRLRNKYIENLKVTFEHREAKICELPDGYYFLRKPSHKVVSSIRYKKSQLIPEILDRLREGWKPGEFVVETANIPFASIYKQAGEN